MEKMLKGNNSLTALNTILLCACFYLLYNINDTVAKQGSNIHNIQSALYWKLNIKTEAPASPYDNNGPTEASLHRDVMVANNQRNNGANNKKEQN